MAGKLTLVATPIGNLGDISPRALDALRECDFIAAEDTRVTLKLLNRFEIKKPLTTYYQHNLREQGDRIIDRILSGENCALCCDAGTPAISDPGEVLVRQAVEAGIEVGMTPGCCAAIMALALSGLPVGRFCFEGFLSVNKLQRRERLDELKNERRTMVFYEAPHKLSRTLKDLRDLFGGDRRIALCRELTKIHEEVERTTLFEAAKKYNSIEPRGEFVLIVEGAAEEKSPDIDISALTAQLLDEGISPSQAARTLSEEYGVSKNAVYKTALEILKGRQ